MRHLIEHIYGNIQRWINRRKTINDVMASVYDELSGFTVFRHNNVMKACNKTTFIEYRLLKTEEKMRKAAEHFSTERYCEMVQEQCFVFLIIPEELMTNNPYKHKIPVGWGTFKLGDERPKWVIAAPNIKDYNNKQQEK